ncbi:MAG: BBP7 family outer membrane beta-barrel protein [Pirellulales bacterium]
MAARFARGRIPATCVIGLLAWLAAASSTTTLRAQEIVGDYAIDDQFASESWGEFDGGACGDKGRENCKCCDVCCDGSFQQDCGDCISREGCWWFHGDLLLLQFDGSHLPPLVTDSPTGISPTLNLPTTKVLAGDQVVGDSWRAGYRLEFGAWLDDCHEFGLLGDYWNAGRDDYDYFFPGDSGRNTGRPFFNAQDGAADVWPISGPDFPIAAPNSFQGTIAITADDELQSAGLTLQRRVYLVGDRFGRGPSTQVLVLGGYRYYSYDSQLDIHDSRTSLDAPRDQVFRHDLFDTDSKFHGGEIGFIARFTQSGCWFDGMAKLAIGGQQNRARINGSTVFVPQGGVATVEEGGLLTSPATNIGTFEDSRARFIPTFRLGAGVNLTPNWTVTVGYNLIVWDGVVRAGSVTPPNLAVDPRNIPYSPPDILSGGASPYFPGLGGSELVAHGLDLGFEYHY